MNPIFKYSSNAKYLTKDFKSGYNNNDFSLLDVHLKEKRPSDKIQLLNIFKDHHSVAKSSHKVAGYDECALSNIFWIKFYNGHGKYNPELNEYSHMYISQLNFAMFCAITTLGISWQHVNHPNLLLGSVIDFMCIFMYE